MERGGSLPVILWDALCCAEQLSGFDIHAPIALTEASQAARRRLMQGGQVCLVRRCAMVLLHPGAAVKDCHNWAEMRQQSMLNLQAFRVLTECVAMHLA